MGKLYLGENQINTVVKVEQSGLKEIIDGSLVKYDNTKVGATSMKANRFTGFTALKKVNLSGITDINVYSCSECTALEEITLDKDTQYIRDNAFSNNLAVKLFNFESSGDLQTIGSGAFRGIGSSRENPSTNRLLFDFSNTKVNTLNADAFAGTSTNKVKYCDIKLPASLTTIGTTAFTYCDNCRIYFNNTIAPTLQSSSFSNATNLKLFIPFGAIHSFQTATNWSTLTSSMVGYAAAGTFDLNESLPEYNAEGYALTWYSDEALTTIVTTCSDSTAIYYCTIGSEKVAVGLTSVFTYDATLVITGNDNRVYKQSYGVLPGTILTFTATPKESGYIPYIFTVNGTTITSGSTYTVQQDTDIVVNCIYWDGTHIPASPVFADNSWVQIASVIRAGGASAIGWQVGDIKEISYLGATLHVRLSDLQQGRYSYVNSNNTTNAVLEFVECLPTTYTMNSTGTNAGGWGGSVLKGILNGIILNNLPADLQSVLEEVYVKAADGGSTNYSGIVDVAGKLFLPAEAELANRSNSYNGEGTKWDYYSTHTSNADRIKYLGTGTTAQRYWTRSAYSNNTYNFCIINNSGSTNNNFANTSYGVVVCFAF